MSYRVMRFYCSVLVLTILSGCGGNSSQGPTFHVGAEVGPVEVRVNIDSQGKPSLTFGLSKRIRLGLGPVGITFGITEAFDKSHDKPYSLFIVWQDPSGNNYQDEYAIGTRFRITFNRQDWVREIAGQNDSIIVAVIRTETQTEQSAITSPAVPTEPATDVPSLKANVTSLRFFECGSEVPAYGNREYQTQFSSLKARFINWELNLSHPSPGRRLEVGIEAIYHRSDGSILARETRDSYIDVGWSTSSHSYGWGGAGFWTPGAYRVELLIDSKKVASGGFSIFQETTPQPSQSENEQYRRQEDERRQSEADGERRAQESRRQQEEAWRRDQEQREAWNREQEQRRKDERTRLIVRGVEEAIERIRRTRRH
jgi:hypothetical protein